MCCMVVSGCMCKPQTAPRPATTTYQMIYMYTPPPSPITHPHLRLTTHSFSFFLTHAFSFLTHITSLFLSIQPPHSFSPCLSYTLSPTFMYFHFFSFHSSLSSPFCSFMLHPSHLSSFHHLAPIHAQPGDHVPLPLC